MRPPAMVDSLVRWQASTVPARVLATVASTRPRHFGRHDRDRLRPAEPPHHRGDRAAATAAIRLRRSQGRLEAIGMGEWDDAPGGATASSLIERGRQALTARKQRSQPSRRSSPRSPIGEMPGAMASTHACCACALIMSPARRRPSSTPAHGAVPRRRDSRGWAVRAPAIATRRVHASGQCQPCLHQTTSAAENREQLRRHRPFRCAGTRDPGRTARAAWAWNIRELECFEDALAAGMLDDQQQCCAAACPEPETLHRS